MERSILVTGGAGYIGSHTCKALHKAGFIPVTYDNLSTGCASAVLWGPLIEGDILDTQKLAETLQKFKPETVIHFAASAYVGESNIFPLKYYNNNVSGTLSLLNAMAERNCHKLVFSSTCATYGLPEADRITESARQVPINTYGNSKLMVEQIIKDQVRIGSLSAVILRYFNAAGADPEGEIGENHDPETHLIPLAIAAASGGPPLTVLGGDYSTPDGTCIRDYVHVTDLAEAHVLAMKACGIEPVLAANLGTGLGSSVQEIIRSVAQHTGRPVKYVMGPRRDGDPPALIADPSRAHEKLRWNAKHSDLSTIVETAIAWQTKRQSGCAGQMCAL